MRADQADGVLAGALDGVQGQVRRAEQFADGAPVGGEVGQPPADRQQPHRLWTQRGELVLAHRAEEPVGQDVVRRLRRTRTRHARLVGVPEQHRELIAPDPRDHVVAAGDLLHQRRRLAEDLVAPGVPEASVVALEVVDVVQQHGRPQAPPARALEDLVADLVEVAAVVGPGEVVGHRQPVQ